MNALIRLFCLALPITLCALAAHGQNEQPQESSKPVVPNRPLHAVERLRKEAAKLRLVVEHDTTRMFLFACNWLPIVSNRTVAYNRTSNDAITLKEHGGLPADTQSKYEVVTLDDRFYFYTKYGSPLAYVRPVEILAELDAGTKNIFKSKRVMDFGFGTVGHLRLLGQLGARVVGVDVDPLLKALYSDPSDQGPIPSASAMGSDVAEGAISLVFGQWPEDDGVATQVGGDFDYIVSKNTLKKGYIHPEKPVDDELRVQLGVTDDEFLAKCFAALKPGGAMLIYNIHPRQTPEYLPWADGRSPFTREACEKAGFSVVKFDQDDTPGVRIVGRNLGWNEGEDAMDIDGDLFATYTLLRRPTIP
jgi:2-polyprenyl-3-methyl-5-hydroxy-6-metoxy-1,4-benzoquinol methylase